MNVKGKLVAVAVAAAFAPLSAFATNGYFGIGFGTATRAMGGAGTAMPQDTLSAAQNPATMVFVGNRVDVGVDFFNPSPRGYEANNDAPQTFPGCGNAPCFPPPSIVPGRVESKNDWFVIPSFGYNHMLDSESSIGVSIGGNGGMNTEYEPSTGPTFQNFAAPPNLAVAPGPVEGSQVAVQPFPTFLAPTDPNNPNPNGVFSATNPTGVDLAQLFVGVTYARKLAPNQSVGITPMVAVQRFKAEGLQPFAQASVDPDHVSNKGYDYSYGIGLQVGWFGKVSDWLSLGISYRTPTKMTKFDKYKGLFADGGKFDIPATLQIGVAYKPAADWTIAGDYQRIFYRDTKAIGNPNNVDIDECFTGIHGLTPSQKPEFCLGGSNGIGFGWDAMDIIKLGAQWDVNSQLALRAGISYNSQFASRTQALFNIVAPAVVRTHATAGGTYHLSQQDEISLTYVHAFKATLDGTSPSFTGTQTGSLFMEQNEIEVSWGHKF